MTESIIPTPEYLRLLRVAEIVKTALGEHGDNLCWRDIYNQEMADLLGIVFDPTLLDDQQMLQQCHEFVRCLREGRPYRVGSREGSFAVERLLHLNCGYCRGWWTIGDGDPAKTYFCPHCGKQQGFKEALPLTSAGSVV